MNAIALRGVNTLIYMGLSTGQLS